MKNPAPHPYTLRLPITPAALGRRYERVFRACRYAAEMLSGGDCRIQAVFEDGERVGYDFAFRTEMERLRLGLYHQSVVQGRPWPLERWA